MNLSNVLPAPNIKTTIAMPTNKSSVSNVSFKSNGKKIKTADATVLTAIVEILKNIVSLSNAERITNLTKA